jgi:hypothetical protein
MGGNGRLTITSGGHAMSHIPVAFSIITASLVAGVLLGGCATTPMGPTARVMPAPGKPFEVFAGDQAMCKQYADGEVGGGAVTANLKLLGTAAVTTALGAGLGAAVHGARGAEVGGALGALGGGALAGRGSAQEQNGLQGRYNLAYTQCMYSRGNQVAGVAPAASRGAYGMASGPAPGGQIPPPAFTTGRAGSLP